jgi:hypothetical protein
MRASARLPFPVEQLVAQLAVDALDDTVLPGLPGAMKAGPIA